MMNLHFHVHYRTNPQQQLAIQYWLDNGKIKQLRLNSADQQNWSGLLEIKAAKIISYQYQVIGLSDTITEYGSARTLALNSKLESYYIRDQWKARSNKKHIFNRSAFKNILLKRKPLKAKRKKATKDVANRSLKLSLYAPDIPSDLCIGIVGSSSALGQWEKPILLSEQNFPIWEMELPWTEESVDLEYKFVWCRASDLQIVKWEEGENRSLRFHFNAEKNSQLLVSDEGFRLDHPWWRAAGLAIPVFSLRSKQGLGIGEFADLKPMIDLAEKTGMKMIQTLPVNDTLASMTWADSYPYAAISVFALHPLYINIQQVGKFKNKKDNLAFAKAQKKLNALEQVDFEAVLKYKFQFLKTLYDQNKKTDFKSAAYKKYYSENKDWLKPYAAFCYLRDVYESPDFTSWSTHNKYDQEAVDTLCEPSSAAYDKLAFYYFLQYHADKQLKEVRAYGQQKGIVLKGDLPIGIYRYSADAWVAPQLYNMEEQAGAPPDDYAVLGQNWGFPTYDWQEMAKDDFKWWQSRMQQLAVYFDALRIDHILGFFRIWQIPLNQIYGTMGLFNPRKPYSREELAQFPFSKPIASYSLPFITQHLIEQTFVKDSKWITKTFFNKLANGQFEFKKNVKTQQEIHAFFESRVPKKYQALREKVLLLATEVLLIEEPNSEGQAFNPRITLNKTFAYQALDDNDRQLFDRLYHDYYHVRHDDFWKTQANWKLPALLDATKMFICGEDLGMIPASVPGVMDQLNIIALEIQRMPKGNTQYGQPAQYPYYSVCSPSCHDMSTIRGWWEGDRENAQRFYNQHWHQPGEAPLKATTDVVQRINQEHLDAPSMLCIFPLQDLLGMMDKLKRKDAFAEQINEPSNSKHYWRYRLHLPIDQLLEENEFTSLVASMVQLSGR